tara:strand:+ start:7162 stop:7632 length:471 start_codon:yes stop_codon:yes gene_type:complete
MLFHEILQKYPKLRSSLKKKSIDIIGDYTLDSVKLLIKDVNYLNNDLNIMIPPDYLQGFNLLIDELDIINDEIKSFDESHNRIFADTFNWCKNNKFKVLRSSVLNGTNFENKRREFCRLYNDNEKFVKLGKEKKFQEVLIEKCNFWSEESKNHINT